jgi:hypothetical protein
MPKEAAMTNESEGLRFGIDRFVERLAGASSALTVKHLGESGDDFVQDFVRLDPGTLGGVHRRLLSERLIDSPLDDVSRVS